MNLKDYKRIDRRYIYPYPVCLVTPGYTVFLQKYLDMDFNKVYMAYDNGMWNVIVNMRMWDKAKKRFEKEYKKDPNIIDKFIKRFKKSSIDYLNFTATLIKKDYSKLSNKDLLNLYNKYNAGYAQCFCYGEPPAQRLKDFLEEELKEKLVKILKDKVNEMFTVMIMPLEDTFITKEEKALLKIAISAKKKGLESIKKELENHNLKYNWISVDYNGAPLALKHFEDSIKILINDSPEKKLENLNNKSKKIREEQLEIEKKYDLSKEIIDEFRIIQKCIHLMDFKKAVFSEAHYHVQFLMTEIGKRIGLNLMQACYMIPEEIEHLLTKNKLADKKIPDERFEKSVYTLDKFKASIATEEEEKQIRSIFNDKTDENELKGICGNPGKVTGTARIIVKTSDFHRFKKGEILVTAFTTPDFTPILKKASAIVTDFGGVTSHASIISRELGIPCVVGTEHATTSIKDGDLIEVDANRCIVKKIKS